MIDKSVPWWTWSKAFEASRKTAWTRWFASSAVCQSSIHCNNCHSADLPRRKPNWSSGMMLFEKQWATKCLWANFSKSFDIFDRELKSATGRYDCESEEGFPLFSISVIMAFFQGFGKTPVVNDMLNRPFDKTDRPGNKWVLCTANNTPFLNWIASINGLSPWRGQDHFRRV